MNTCDVLWGVLIALVLMVIVQYLKHGCIRKALAKTGDSLDPTAKPKDEPAAKKSGTFVSGMTSEMSNSSVPESGTFESKLAGQLHEHFNDVNDKKVKKSSDSYDDEDDDYTEHILTKNVNPEVVKNHKDFVKDRKRYSRQPNMPSDDLEFSYVNYQGLGRRNAVIKQDSSARSVHGLKDSDYTRSNWNFNFG